ncbi:FAD/NAD(P)-binding domain-containing protein [Agrocybe pediades]|nr:FAD/NAD(P)-binding domain-containing protein [Agrocybe pediades]
MSIHPKLRIAVVGGGIGGLAFAVAISKLNLEEFITVDIYDASTKLSQVGAGIAFFPRGWEIMKNMGLEEDLEAKLPPGQEKPTLDKERLYYQTRKSNQPVGTHIVDLMLPGGSVTLHRADVQTILLKHLPSSIRCHLSHRLTGYVETNEGVQLNFENGKTALCDLMIGADGLHSATRKTLLSEGKNWTEQEAIQHSRPLWTGVHVYRYVADAALIKQACPENRALSKVMLYCGKNKHIVAFPMRQGELVNIVLCISNPGQEGTYIDGPTVTEATQDDIAHLFECWEEDVRVLVENTLKPSRWAIQYIKPLDKYVSQSGRVILLGDAAHATGPFFANGGGLAIEDAFFLANIIGKALEVQESTVDVPKIARIYNEIRQPFCNSKAAGSLELVRYYQFLNPRFEEYGDGVDLPAEKVSELAKLLTESVAWTVDSVMPDLEKALALW